MFRVEWIQSALDELTTIWLQAPAAQRAAITSASHSIDRLLETDPHNAGESRPGGNRVLFVAPLGDRRGQNYRASGLSGAAVVHRFFPQHSGGSFLWLSRRNNTSA